MKAIENVSVVGSGAMGNGIAHVFALNGYAVTLIDVSVDALRKALKTIEGNLSRQVSKETIDEKIKQETLGRIRTESSLEEGVKQADLVVEAATEKLAIKSSIFQTIDQHAPAHAILTSNTSSISITQIAAGTNRPQQVAGMHFMNPVPIMKLVEVIRGYQTSDETTAVVLEAARHLGKSPVEVNDYPGFVANRILMPMINEAVYALHEGVAGVQEIDEVMKLGMAHPMGPLQLADFIGLDVCHYILKVMHEGFGNPKYASCPLLVNMVQAGHLGLKSGVGFYTYEKGSKQRVVAPRFQRV